MCVALAGGIMCIRELPSDSHKSCKRSQSKGAQWYSALSFRSAELIEVTRDIWWRIKYLFRRRKRLIDSAWCRIFSCLYIRYIRLRIWQNNGNIQHYAVIKWISSRPLSIFDWVRKKRKDNEQNWHIIDNFSRIFLYFIAKRTPAHISGWIQ